ncbi:MAG: Mpv17/PMP22 family protein [Candidatus Izimaplasma sp.]|nr:Mpv17/PMP22 family protein [Candidatus Izimaplasma bacterium]
MKKDRVISILVFLITGILIYIVTRDFFLAFAGNMPLVAGFVKFFFLATIGDFIGLRIKKGVWGKPNYLLAKATIWGLIGIVIVLMFKIFPEGVLYLQSVNILPFDGSIIAFAIFTSVLMNLTFAPTMMAFHRISDTYLNLKYNNKDTKFSDAVNDIKWNQFFSFIVLKTIPLFWIPAHTLTFLLPSEYRVIFAAVLGIFLGLILGLFKNK